MRTSTVYPDPHIDGGTMFLPVNISETTIQIPCEDDSGNVTYADTPGYRFDEYRINKAVDLPEEATQAMAEAFQLSCQALKILGVM